MSPRNDRRRPHRSETSPGDPEGRPGRVSAGALRAARTTRPVLTLLGWVSFGLIVLTALVEHHPSLERMVADAVRARLEGPLVETIEIEDIDVLWMRREVALNGVRMGPTGEDLVADSVVLRVGWSRSRGLHLDRVRIEHGGVTLSRALSEDLGSVPAAEAQMDTSGTILELLSGSPEVVVRDFSIGVELPSREHLSIGTVDLCLRRRGDEIASIWGRLLPTIVGPDEDHGVIWLNGTVDRQGVARVEGVAHALQLSADAGASVESLRALERFHPEARIDLVAHAELDTGHAILPNVTARMRVSDGTMRLPWLPEPDLRPVEDVDLAVAVAFDPEGVDDPFDPSAWSARGTLEADWDSIRATAGFRAGSDAPAGTLFEVWADLPSAPLGKELSELVAGEPGIVEIDAMLEPDGTADVSLGVRLPRGTRPDGRLDLALERLVLIRPDGGASLAYHGGIDSRTGRRDVGFPLPVRRVAGDVTWSIRPAGRYPGQLGLYGLQGYHSDGPVGVVGSLHFTPLGMFADRTLADLVPAPFHLRVDCTGLPIDADFERGLRGLGGVQEAREVLPTWNPSGGRIDFELELWRTETRSDLSMDLDARLDGISARWSALEVPVEDARGTLRVRTDGRGPVDGCGLLQIELEARTPVARAPLVVRGRVESEGLDRSASWYSVEVDQVNTRSGELRTELARKVPAALGALDASGVAGFVDVDVLAVQSTPLPEGLAMRASDPVGHAYSGGLEAWTQVVPSDPSRGLQLQPTKFPIVTRAAQGRLVATTSFPPEALEAPATPPSAPAEGPYVASTRIAAALHGQWRQTGPSVPVVARVEAATGAAARLTAYGAGLDIANRSLVGALTNVAELTSTTGGVDPIDTDAFQVAGRVDFGASFTLPEAPGVPATETTIEVDARLDRLGFDGNQILSNVSAHVRFDDATRQWLGEAIDAKLGSTPVRLSNVVWTTEDDGSTFEADITAEGLPIDRDHLRFFLDPATLRKVLDDLRMRGTFGLRPGHLVIGLGRDGSKSLRLTGELGIDDAFVDLGMPVEIAHVDSVDLDLRHEGRGLRTRASVDGMYGAIAGRRLEDATLQLTYVEPRLVIEALSGRIEGGRLSAIGGDRARGADLFTLDLVPPFPFRLAADFEGVDIGRFLRGMFDSDFANRGTMDLSMQLEGDFDRLTGIDGGGEIHVSDSALWAIPVFQALSATLGIDTTVTFREMSCGYSIGDGRLDLDWMRVESDLLSLVGSGSIDFEGDVSTDMEVRYALVDRLGPFTRLLYYIQNSLLRVSIRGTMERPSVVLRGLISQFFAPADEGDRLPLPGFSERPRRF